MEASAFFSRSYVEARDRFRAAVAARGRPAIEHPHPTARGSAGEALSIDAALLGHDDAKALLVITSGTHGVEGFCGAGCQTALLADDAFFDAVERAGIAVLFVHALNPYGFAHLRRVTEENVDLNRNFRDFSQPPPANPLYAELHPVLLPREWPPSADNQAAIAGLVARHGLAMFQAVVSSGQYQFADGMFYGGAGPTFSHRTIRALLREHGHGRRRLAWIDLHTGLGPAGHGEKIYAGRDDTRELARARDWWGNDVTSFHEGSSSSAALHGAMYNAAYEECPEAEFTGLTLEFGTVSLPQVFTALRADHWLHNHPDANDQEGAAIKRQMLDAFYTDAPDWKAKVLAQAGRAALAAVQRLGRAG